MLLETIRLAVQAIFRNAFRSFLTVLGIVIGVGAVIAMITVGQGSARQVMEDVEKLGSNILMVLPGKDTMQGGPQGTVDPAFNLKDADLIADQLPFVQIAAPVAFSRARAVYGNENWRTDVVGTRNDYFEAAQWEIAEGRLFDEADLRSGKPVCIIGETVREKLFDTVRPVGETIRVGSLSCEVIGLTQSKGASTFGSDQDDFVIMPVKTFHRRVAGNTDVSMIYISTSDTVALNRARDELELLLRDMRRIGSGEEDDFSVTDMEQIADMLSGITSILTGLLSAVAAVSLLVGGIGIMNIMLVSVAERTREIGIRLAVGAQARQVLLQFLVEAIVLSLIGGIIGIVLGLVLGYLGAEVLNVPFAPDASIILIAFSFSACVGVIFGFFPARRAARMDPIEALRHD